MPRVGAQPELALLPGEQALSCLGCQRPVNGALRLPRTQNRLLLLPRARSQTQYELTQYEFFSLNFHISKRKKSKSSYLSLKRGTVISVIAEGERNKAGARSLGGGDSHPTLRPRPARPGTMAALKLRALPPHTAACPSDAWDRESLSMLPCPPPLACHSAQPTTTAWPASAQSSSICHPDAQSPEGPLCCHPALCNHKLQAIHPI